MGRVKEYISIYMLYLMPCPGPHKTFSIHKLVLPGPIETQSSPVLILEFKIVTPDDNCT